jgi:hypothetical protein
MMRRVFSNLGVRRSPLGEKSSIKKPSHKAESSGPVKKPTRDELQSLADVLRASGMKDEAYDVEPVRITPRNDERAKQRAKPTMSERIMHDHKKFSHVALVKKPKENPRVKAKAQKMARMLAQDMDEMRSDQEKRDWEARKRAYQARKAEEHKKAAKAEVAKNVAAKKAATKNVTAKKAAAKPVTTKPAAPMAEAAQIASKKKTTLGSSQRGLSPLQTPFEALKQAAAEVKKGEDAMRTQKSEHHKAPVLKTQKKEKKQIGNKKQKGIHRKNAGMKKQKDDATLEIQTKIASKKPSQGDFLSVKPTSLPEGPVMPAVHRQQVIHKKKTCRVCQTVCQTSTG